MSSYLEQPTRHFYQHFMRSAEHLPMKKMRVRKNVPYMNTEWKAAIRRKEVCEEIQQGSNYRVMGTNENLEKQGHTTEKEGD